MGGKVNDTFKVLVMRRVLMQLLMMGATMKAMCPIPISCGSLRNRFAKFPGCFIVQNVDDAAAV